MRVGLGETDLRGVALGSAFRRAGKHVLQAVGGQHALAPDKQRLGIRPGDPLPHGLVQRTEPALEQPQEQLRFPFLPALLPALLPAQFPTFLPLLPGPLCDPFR